MVGHFLKSVTFFYCPRQIGLDSLVLIIDNHRDDAADAIPSCFAVSTVPPPRGQLRHGQFRQPSKWLHVFPTGGSNFLGYVHHINMALVNRSMVLKRSAAVVGIEEFIDKRKERLVIHGCIKMKAEDFVVHEISAAGEVVKLGDKIDRLPSEEERNAVLKKLEGAHQKEKKERFEFDDPEGGWRSALIQQIGTKGFQGVESVAKGLRNDFFVISPTELRERVYLQVCIQNCFPGLDCKIHEQDLVSLEEDAVQQIQVILDPVYKKFREGGVGQVNCDRLLTFLRKGAGDPMALNGLELEHEDTKKARTALHRLVAKHSSSFKSKTEKRNGKQCVVVYFLPKNIKKRKRHHRTVYLQFVLQKKNVEHFLAFEKLARLLRCSLSAFSYAGTKDKAALTFQHVVVCGVDPKELLKVNGMEPGIRVGNLSYVETPLTLGGGYGNKFLISVRDLTVNTTQLPAETLRSTLELTLKNIQHQGFVNYFGFQRVGHPTGTVRPHHIGEKMIASKWKEALKLILEVQDVDTMDTMKAKRLYLDSGDIDAALKLMPLNMVVERHVLQGLKRFGSNAFEQAVQTLPFSRRLMYLHAYQSYLFNRVASFRLRYYEKKVVQGDLIRYDTGKDKAVKAVTADEANEMNESSENAIRHVLLPLVGPNIVLPGNATNDAYVKVLEQDGTKDALLASCPVKGAYRSLIAYPHDLEWTWHHDQDQSLSLQLSFALEKGCFATMCIREILYSDPCSKEH